MFLENLIYKAGRDIERHDVTAAEMTQIHRFVDSHIYMGMSGSSSLGTNLTQITMVSRPSIKETVPELQFCHLLLP